MTTPLDGGITLSGTGTDGTEWNILGQRYFPKATCDAAFAFEANSAPGQFVPVHIHPTHGRIHPRVAGGPARAEARRPVADRPRRRPRAHAARHSPRLLQQVRHPLPRPFLGGPRGRLRALFETLHDMTDIPAIVAASAAHDVDFLPPEAND